MLSGLKLKLKLKLKPKLSVLSGGYKSKYKLVDLFAGTGAFS